MEWTSAPDAASFVTLAEFKAFLRRDVKPQEGDDARLIEALNAAAGKLREWTGRELHTKVWRTPVRMSEIEFVYPADDGTESPTLSTNEGVFTGIVQAGDDVFGAYARPFQRVVAVRPNEIDLNYGWTYAEGWEGPRTFSFGSRPMYVSGDGSSTVCSIEFPVTEVISAAQWDGTEWVSVDITGARFDCFDLGRIDFPYATFESGSRNVRLEVRAGYVEPSASDAGHPEDWSRLRRLTLWLAAKAFSDDASFRWSGTSPAGGGRGSLDSAVASMPEELAQSLAAYRRLA